MLICREFSSQDNYRQGMHAHEQGQLQILHQGSMVFSTAVAEYLMTPQRPCWIPPHASHGALARGDMRGMVIQLPPSLCENLPGQVCIFKGNEFIQQLSLQMLKAISSAEKTAQRLQHLWQVMEDELAIAAMDSLHLPMPSDKKLRNLCSLLADNPADERSLQDWADHIHISQRSLVRKFKAETGLTFSAWRQVARIMLAIQLLNKGDNVTSVALSVGYDSLSAFIAVFRQMTGASPSHYLAD